MADHLDFIRIRGLESSDDEVFQGLGAESLTLTATGTGASGSSSSWLEKLLTDTSGAFDSILRFITGKAPDVGVVEEGEEGSRGIGRSRGFGALVPYVGGALALVPELPPAVLGVAALTAFVHQVNGIIDDIEDVFDPLDPGWRLLAIEKKLKSIDDHFKTAFIWEDGILGIDKSIMGTALMEDENSLVRIGIDELKAAIEALKYNDEEIVIGDLHAYLRNKIVEY